MIKVANLFRFILAIISALVMLNTEAYDYIIKNVEYDISQKYEINGIAHIHGNITSSEKPSVAVIHLTDVLSDKDETLIAAVDSLGTYDIDVPVKFPHFMEINFPTANTNVWLKDIYIQPNDTLSISVKAANNISVAYDSLGSESAAITESLMSINDLLRLPTLEYNLATPDYDATIDSIDALCKVLDTTVNDIPKLVSELNISDLSKDIIISKVIGDLYSCIIHTAIQYEMANRIPNPETGAFDGMHRQEYEPIEFADIFERLKTHEELLFNNPVMSLSNHNAINSMIYLPLFRLPSLMAAGVDKDSSKPLDLVDLSHEITEKNTAMTDEYGVSGDFMQDLSKLIYINQYRLSKNNVSNNDIDYSLCLVNEIMPLIRNNGTRNILIANYTDFVKRNTQSSSTNNSLSDDTVLGGLVSQYKGNVIYVDLWSLGCAPCRSGILSQRAIIDRWNGLPVKVLYVASESEKSQCEKWMSQNNIRGEHIYISEDDWNAIFRQFNIAYIPYGILIDKAGAIVQTDYILYENEPTIESLLRDSE